MGYKYTDEVHKLVTFSYGEDKWFSGIDKAVLLTLASYAKNETGKCHPGYGRIASETCFSRKAVQRSVSNLKCIGFIVTEATTDRSTLTYTINLKAIADILMAQDEGGKANKKPKRKGAFAKAAKRTVHVPAPIGNGGLVYDDDDELA